MGATNFTYRLKALLILLVFGISLLPRQIVHNFVTSHKHVRHTTHPGKAQLSAETFSCTADTVFLQQNYDAPVTFSTATRIVFGVTGQPEILSLYYCSGNSFISLRGPPQIV